METPPVLTRDQVRSVDRVAIERYGMSGLVLMENAGRGVVDVLLEVDPKPVHVVILCGQGNNGGDGFVIARHLAIRGVRSSVVLLGGSGALAGDALANWKILQHCLIATQEFTGAASELGSVVNQEAAGARWLVDAMLGTGAVGEPREPLATAIRWMNDQPARRLAVDIPSGLDCDTGVAASATVRADVTCTFVAMKQGFLEAAARPFLGEVRVVHIGVPASLARLAAGV
jgi:NAD(P)H-hydrate epimerase